MYREGNFAFLAFKKSNLYTTTAAKGWSCWFGRYDGIGITFAILFTAADSLKQDADDENSLEDQSNEGMKDEDKSGECVFVTAVQA